MKALHASIPVVVVGTILAAPCARADVTLATDNGFVVTERREVRAAPDRLAAAVSHVDEWWNDEHTFSDHAANLKLEASAGACFCERWAGGSVQHAQVIYVTPELVRLVGALGPLQGLAVNGVLTFTIQKPDKADAAAKNWLVVTYRVGGGQVEDMRRLPPMVDAMMSDTSTRLARYLDRP